MPLKPSNRSKQSAPLKQSMQSMLLLSSVPLSATSTSSTSSSTTLATSSTSSMPSKRSTPSMRSTPSTPPVRSMPSFSGLLLLLPSLTHAIFPPYSSSNALNAVNAVNSVHVANSVSAANAVNAAFVLGNSCRNAPIAPVRPVRPVRSLFGQVRQVRPMKQVRQVTTASLVPPDYFKEHPNGIPHERDGGYCYIPPYGTVPRSSSIVLNVNNVNNANSMDSRDGTGYSSDYSSRNNSANGYNDRYKNYDNYNYNGYNGGNYRDMDGPLGIDTMDTSGNNMNPRRELMMTRRKNRNSRGGERGGVGGVGGSMGGAGGVRGEGAYGPMERPPGAPFGPLERPPPPYYEGGFPDDDEYLDLDTMNPQDDYFSGEGGNYWVNPQRRMDRYGPGGGRRDGRRGGMGSRNSVRNERRRGRNGRNGRGGWDGDDEPWWETRRNDEYYDDDEWDDLEGYNEYGVPPPSRSRSSFRTGAPPPPRPVKDFYDKLFWFGFDPDVTRPTDRTMFGGTRGKFNAMDLLRDRERRQEMREREMERRASMGLPATSSYDGGGGRSRRSLRGKNARDPAIQDFGKVEDWNARKNGTGRSGGVNLGDASVEDRELRDGPFDGPYGPGGPDIRDGPDGPYPMYDVDPFYDEFGELGDYPPPPPPYLEPDVDFPYEDEDEFDFEPRRRRGRDILDRRGRHRRGRRGARGFFNRLLPSLPSRNSRRREAEAYDRYMGFGPPSLDEEYGEDGEYYGKYGRRGSRNNRRRRKGYAYKYTEDDEYEDDIPPVAEYEVIDAQRIYDDEDDEDDTALARRRNPIKRTRRSTSSKLTPRRRTWEERALERDRVPPRGAMAWGPNGRAGIGFMDAQTKAALDAIGEIRKCKRFFERKEEVVLDAEEEVVALKADASFHEKQLANLLSTNGRNPNSAKANQLQRQYEIILQDVEDATRILRLARAERDAAQKIVEDLNAKHWALLSEYEAAKEFEDGEWSDYLDRDIYEDGVLEGRRRGGGLGRDRRRNKRTQGLI